MKILIIDNQYTQFEQLKRRIEEVDDGRKEFDVVPDGEADFKSLMSSVKVYIYDGEKRSNDPDPDIEAKNSEYRRKAWANILSYVNDCDIILMDFRLGSSLTCLTGLQLSIKIWEEKDVPILILSRDEQTREDILDDWNKVKEQNENRISWLVKGYWGAKLLPLGFVSGNIIPAVKRLRSTFIHSGQIATLWGCLENRINQLLILKWSNHKDEALIQRLNYIVSKRPQSCIEDLKALVEPLNKQTSTRLNDTIKRQIKLVNDKFDRESNTVIFTGS